MSNGTNQQKPSNIQKPIFISFSAEINQNTTESFMAVIAEQINRGVKDFYILLSTPGGIVANGITLYNYLRSLKANITMHNIGVVDSIGNVIFLAGEQRYAVPNSSFLFHGVGFDITQVVRLEEKDLKEKLKIIERDQNLMSNIITERTKLKAEDIEKMFLEAATKTAEEAKEIGIINDIKLADIPKDAQILQFAFQQRPWR